MTVYLAACIPAKVPIFRLSSTLWVSIPSDWNIQIVSSSSFLFGPVDLCSKRHAHMHSLKSTDKARYSVQNLVEILSWNKMFSSSIYFLPLRSGVSQLVLIQSTREDVVFSLFNYTRYCNFMLERIDLTWHAREVFVVQLSSIGFCAVSK